jgi:hypothetical protein
MKMSVNAAAERARGGRRGSSAPLLESLVFKQVLVICCVVAAGVLVRLESLAALGVPRMLGVIGVAFVIVSALFAFSFAIAERVLRARRDRQMDATAAWFSRHYRQLLDESTLNPLRRHP